MSGLGQLGLLVLALGACGQRSAVERPNEPPGTQPPAPAPVPDTSDADGDGYEPPLDCDDRDVSVHPGAEDRPYDGVDADCAGGEEYDLDGDGHDAQAYGGGDCDDTDPLRYAGAPRVCGNSVDDDCDLAWDCDLRGDLYVEDVAIAAFTGAVGSAAGNWVDVGDVDGDGAVDVLLPGDQANQTWLFRGPLLVTRSADSAEAVFAGGLGGGAFGDFDGDGLDDVATTSDGVFLPMETNIHLASSGWGTPAARLVHGEAFLMARETDSGDVTGDGVSDLLLGNMGSCAAIDPAASDGCIAVYPGPFEGIFDDTSVGSVVVGEEVSAFPGWAMDAERDVTGDGLTDLVLADYGVGTAGKFYVVESPLLPIELLAEVSRTFDPDSPVYGGNAVEVVSGDLDADGYADVLMATSGQVATPGFAWVFRGPVAGALSGGDAFVFMEDVNARSAAMPGDLDGDGLGDLVVGDTLNTSGNGSEAAKIAYAPRGTVVPDALVQGLDDSNGIGQFASPGDIDGDGLADLVAGTPGLAIDGVQHGGAFVILGRPQGF